jgi:hypothetical protein
VFDGVVLIRVQKCRVIQLAKGTREDFWLAGTRGGTVEKQDPDTDRGTLLFLCDSGDLRAATW